jgi:hypothetical protein
MENLLLFGIAVAGSNGNINFPMRISHVGQHRMRIELPQTKIPVLINWDCIRCLPRRSRSCYFYNCDDD